MDFLTGGILVICVLLFLMALGVQIGLAFLLAGFAVSVLLLGFDSSLTLMGQAAYHSIATPTWASIPLFILMGAFASGGGLARRAYDGVNAMSRGLPGSLLIATSISCGVFGAVSGSSIATTAIFGKMALPEMNRLGYDKQLSTGCIASAGTFASMIPPSMMMIIYALFTQQSIGKLFAAGVVPGIITVIAYSIFIYFLVKRKPSLAPQPKHEEGVIVVSRARSALGLWPVALIATLVLGGMYSGWFTPTEAAAVGAVATLAYGWFSRTFVGAGDVTSAMRESASVTAMLFLINIGALFYSRVLAVTRLPTELAMMLQVWDVPPFAVLMGVVVIMFFLGMIMVPVGIYALTLPIVFPLLVSLGYDPIWFGVIALKMTEIGAITPPVGLNAFAMKGVIPPDMKISLEDIYRGCMPFILIECCVLAILIAFPALSTWLPNLLLG